ncbi:amidohydrolase [Niabella beijingensis]|uniref:amidohydrolase n=1 Tax=Niabella beijingensis TaxID=2872700 RepID=UPI001CBE8DF5|nr:amidohydrolase [Niabella beijingensis]MBZ4189105.1 amidohydrolase [Niabella beijingensis]
MRSLSMIFLACCMIAACKSQDNADLLIYNATLYTVDSLFSKAEAMVIRDGKVVATGTRAALESRYHCKDRLDAGGKFIYPGFIDAHAHFAGYAKRLGTLDLVNTTSWEDILQRLQGFKTNRDAAAWLVGGGWDQNDWPVKQFPTNEALNKQYPNTPVYLTRIDGHAAIANAKALELAGVKAGDTITGGTYETRDGRLTGILIDNAMEKVASVIPDASAAEMKQYLLQAQQQCFATGLTSIHDCGLDYEAVEAIGRLQQAGDLKMRLYILLSDASKNYDYLLKKGVIRNDYLHVQGFKLYADGALGSRGACLLDDYSDKPGWKGFLLSAAPHFDSMARLISKNNWQMCTHAIGDSANRTLLEIYARYLGGKNDLRWRIEHAQVVNENDFHFFGDYSIIPSVQPTHATSDMYWAGARLGEHRLKGAYANRQLLNENGWLPLGTDFPVEDLSPFKTFYAAVVRKDAKGFPAGGFQVDNALSREQALRGMTIWAARAAFEEREKGSLEPGKLADFVILDQDLMTAPETALLKTTVLRTFSGGQQVFERR